MTCMTPPTTVRGLPRIAQLCNSQRRKGCPDDGSPLSHRVAHICKMHNALTPNSSNDCYISSVAREGYLGDAGCFCPRLIVVLAPGAQGRKFTVTGAGGDSTYTIETNEHAVQGEGGCVYSFDSGLSEEWVIISGKPAVRCESI